MEFEELDKSIEETFLAHDYILRKWRIAKIEYRENDNYEPLEELIELIERLNPATTLVDKRAQEDIVDVLKETVENGKYPTVVFLDDVTKFLGNLKLNTVPVTAQSNQIKEDTPTINISMTNTDYDGTPIQSIKDVTLTDEDGQPVTKTGTVQNLNVANYTKQTLNVKYTLEDKVGSVTLKTVDAGVNTGVINSSAHTNVNMVVGTAYSNKWNNTGNVRLTAKTNYKFDEVKIGTVAQSISGNGEVDQVINVNFLNQEISAKTSLKQRAVKVVAVDANVQSVVVNSPKNANVTMVNGTAYSDDITATGTLRITPKTGYKLRSVKFGNTSQQLTNVNGAQTLNFNFSANVDVSVETEPITYTVTFDLQDNTRYAYKTYKIGTGLEYPITGETVTIPHGSSTTFKFIPLVDYKIVSAKFDGVEQTITDPQLVTFTKTITKNVSIELTLGNATFDVLITADTPANIEEVYYEIGGAFKTPIQLGVPEPIVKGAMVKFTMVPKSGFKLVTMRVNGGSEVNLGGLDGAWRSPENEWLESFSFAFTSSPV